MALPRKSGQSAKGAKYESQGQARSEARRPWLPNDGFQYSAPLALRLVHFDF
jgi:hypothetical protein